MNSRSVPWCAALLLTVLSLGMLLAQAPVGKKYALLVGIKAYDHGKLEVLQYTENDVVELARLLEKAGYEVVLLCDSTGAKDTTRKPTLANIRTHLDTLLDRTKRHDTMLVALAGHGLQFDRSGDSYFCPCDANPSPERKHTLLSLRDLYRKLDDSGAGIKLLVVDACRNQQEETGRGRGVDADSAPPPPKGVAALYSCSAGERAFETAQYQHGVFFYHLLEGLRGKARNTDDEVTWDTLAGYVRTKVTRDPLVPILRPQAKQNPNSKGDLSGESPVLLRLNDLGKTDLGKTDLGKTVETRPEFSNKIDMKLVLIKAANQTFRMGWPKEEKDRENDEKPHQVILTKDFYLGKFPVTKGQFARFLHEEDRKSEAEQDGQGGYGIDQATGKYDGPKPEYTWKNPGFDQADDHPVVNVSWNDAVAFCKWLTRKEGIEYRLPTEAEWEFACRAGTTTRYFTGDAEDSLRGHANVRDQSLKATRYGKNYSDNYFGFDDGYPFTSPVGHFKPNKFGLCDMTGNVWHWCADWYGEYNAEEKRDPQGPEKGTGRVLRGGSWYGDPRGCRAAFRVDDAPGVRNCIVGFRVAAAARTP